MPGLALPSLRATVVGGGPAGLIAAEVLARGGLAVTVFDHMPSVGRKLLLAGRSGLNLTHAEPVDAFVARYEPHSAQMTNALLTFSPTDLREWAHELGIETFVGSSGRVFPLGLRATPLLRAWLRRLHELGVTFETRARWAGWHEHENREPWQPDTRRPRFDSTTSGDADVTVLALGGASWPRVGSDGSWTTILRSAGVEVRDLEAANCAVHVQWSAPFIDRFEGAPIKNVVLTSHAGTSRGDVVVTKRGLEGGPVYALASQLRSVQDAQHSLLTFDLKPDLSLERVTALLENRKPKESLTNSLKRTLGLTPAAIGFLRESTANALPFAAADLARCIKQASLHIDELASLDRAISSSGGVTWPEIDDNFMLNALPGVFVAGEMIDWDAPTGGYLLQGCFSTGVAAAHGALAWLAHPTAHAAPNADPKR